MNAYTAILSVTWYRTPGLRNSCSLPVSACTTPGRMADIISISIVKVELAQQIKLAKERIGHADIEKQFAPYVRHVDGVGRAAGA